MEKYESRLRSPVHLRMDGKSLNLVVHVVSFFSRADTLRATRLSGGRLFGKWRIRDDIGKVGGCVPLDVSNAEIPNDVVKGGLRLPTSDVAKALFESVFKCQARKFG